MFSLDVIADPALILLILAMENPMITLAVIAVAVILIITIIALKKRK